LRGDVSVELSLSAFSPNIFNSGNKIAATFSARARVSGCLCCDLQVTMENIL
jgi:hypothetical protein